MSERADGPIWQSQQCVEQWERGREGRLRAGAAVDEALFEFAALAPGMTVLEVGAGTGDTAVRAAELVGRDGSVTAVDISAAMTDVLLRRVADAGLTNVKVLTVDAQKLDLPAGSYDVVIARNSLMFMEDLEGVLAIFRKLLRPAGRLVISVWGAPDRNPLISCPVEVMREVGVEVTSAMTSPQGLRLSDPQTLQEVLETAGYSDVEIRTAGLDFRAETLDQALERFRESPSVMMTLGTLPAASREDAWTLLVERWRRYDGAGGFNMPGEALVVRASA